MEYKGRERVENLQIDRKNFKSQALNPKLIQYNPNLILSMGFLFPKT